MLDEFDLRGSGRECGFRKRVISARDVCEGGKDKADFRDDGIERVDFNDRSSRSLSKCERSSQRFLQSKFERGNPVVGVNKLIERFKKRVQRSGLKRA